MWLMCDDGVAEVSFSARRPRLKLSTRSLKRGETARLGVVSLESPLDASGFEENMLILANSAGLTFFLPTRGPAGSV